MKKNSRFVKSIINTFIIAFGITSVTLGQSIDQGFFNRVDALLSANVSNGLVDYNSLKSDAAFTTLIDEIANADISQLDGRSLQAFYINAYNLHVINQIIKHSPLTSVMDVPGFFDKNLVTVAQSQMTLNQLEKERLISQFNDPRFHFVLVCGANGCPPITSTAYTPDQLQSQLEQQTKAAINDPTFIKVSDNQVELSQIFNWYASDFGGKSNVVSYINQYRQDPIEVSTEMSHYEYDWSLNTK